MKARIRLLVASVVLLIASSSFAAVHLRYQWDVPTTGMPVDYYIVEARAAVGDTIWTHPDQTPIVIGASFTSVAVAPTNSWQIYVEDEAAGFQIRVAGVDEHGRQGGFSIPAEIFTDPGAPGQPGQPSYVIVGVIILGLAILLALFFRRR